MCDTGENRDAMIHSRLDRDIAACISINLLSRACALFFVQ